MEFNKRSTRHKKNYLNPKHFPSRYRKERDPLKIFIKVDETLLVQVYSCLTGRGDQIERPDGFLLQSRWEHSTTD